MLTGGLRGTQPAGLFRDKWGRPEPNTLRRRASAASRAPDRSPRRALAKESNMTSKISRHTIWLILAASLAVSGGAFAKGPGSGGGGGGNKPPTEAGFNLSVPAIMAVIRASLF